MEQNHKKNLKVNKLESSPWFAHGKPILYKFVLHRVSNNMLYAIMFA